MNLSIHRVTYSVTTNPAYPQSWHADFFYEAEAEDFKNKLTPGIFIESSNRPVSGPVYEEAILGTPYRYLKGTYIKLGEYSNCRGSYTTTAFTTKELHEAALIVYEARKARDRKAMDSYYSQPWV